MKLKIIFISTLLFIIISQILFFSCNNSRSKHLNNPNKLRVMSYNIHYGKGMDGLFSLENIAGVINKSNADIVGLQEISDSLMADRLGELTNMHVVFGQSLGKSNGYGDAILSKLPFEWVNNLSIPSASSSRYQAMAVDIELPNNAGSVRIINTHFDWLKTLGSEHARLSSIDVIEEAFFKENSNLPVILTADLNSLPNSDVLKKLEEYGWVNYTDGNTYHTYSSTKPEKQIDYILYRSNKILEVENMFVMYGEESSDHLPVVMDLILR